MHHARSSFSVLVALNRCAKPVTKGDVIDYACRLPWALPCARPTALPSYIRHPFPGRTTGRKDQPNTHQALFFLPGGVPIECRRQVAGTLIAETSVPPHAEMQP